ncbi:MAG: ribonuclease T2 family protein [Gemmobacter sp.]
MRLILMLCLALASPVRAEGDRAGAFDYYIAAFSWTPAWCAAEGDARGDARCADGAGKGFGLHGLWPQHERGWPSWCRTVQRDPTRAETAAAGQLYGSAGLAWHQWQKHGRCSGLSARDYYLASARALDRVRMPRAFARMDHAITIDAAAVEAAFLAANPGLTRDMVTVTCRDGAIHEVRVCLTRTLEPRRCGADAIRDCRLRNARMDPPR